ncbi:hypothetical protein DL96DRAFT_1474351 [Flagelloscypha sp. PMI_526]|nr:hypothetical protein DL96DRAFT_1474351 [Flagelloscypha sp. PMI_526]
MTSSTEKSEETVPLRSDAELHSDDESEETPRVSALQRQLAEDQRFNPAPPSRLKRAALIFLILGLFWLAFKLRPQKERPIVYASRYSKEHKFRPAASPIVT